MDKIIVRGAREHNLKNISLELPRNKMIVMTGISGSGKSSLAFDTIFAEGQRRYVESLSAYARQFLGDMDKPDVDYIEGLSPAISIDQKSTSKNPRSTVGTITEIYDYLRVLFARAGIPHCPNCGKEVSRQTSQQIIEKIMEIPDGERFLILSPVVRGRKGEYRELFKKLQSQGFVRVKVDGKNYELDEDIVLDKNIKHDIKVVVDRLVMKSDIRQRIADSVETALVLSSGMAEIESEKINELFSEHFACDDCGISLPELSPRMFSFNSPYGACQTCAGLGYQKEIDLDYIINKNLSLADGAIIPWSSATMTIFRKMLRGLAEEYGFNMKKKWKDLSDEHKNIILYGSEKRIPVSYINQEGSRVVYGFRYEGVIPNLTRRHRETESNYAREKIEEYMTTQACAACGGTRLRPESLAVTFKEMNISQLTARSAEDSYKFFANLKLTEKEEKIARRIIKEIKERLQFMVKVGLNYLTLDRNAATLSGGEAQRIRLATQIGSSLMGVLYVLDEPSIGLHARDNKRLIETLHRLRDIGNTLIVVEHDEETIHSADWIVDIGPGAGEAGGRIVVSGEIQDILNNEKSITGSYLSGKSKIKIPNKRRTNSNGELTLVGAKQNNLKNITVEMPLGKFICITGVSGSGKSTLIRDILYPVLTNKLYNSKLTPGKYDDIKGLENIDKVIDVDQSPIGRTPRSNPATYTGLFDHIRKLFSETTEAKIRGYQPGRFSFNVKGGRCEICRGDGTLKIEMHFLPDVYINCDVCKGKRYNIETLDVHFKGKNIADVLDMSVTEAIKLFENIPQIKRKLVTLDDVGLGYIKLGQSATTLSGGEAQRIKLSKELSKRGTGRTVYLLDEPTTGLHFADIEKLLSVLMRLVDTGNTVIVIEHNLDVVKVADWIIDLGPEGGDKGGYVIATGTPEQITKNKKSYTGKYLSKRLNRHPPS